MLLFTKGFIICRHLGASAYLKYCAVVSSAVDLLQHTSTG